MRLGSLYLGRSIAATALVYAAAAAWVIEG
jgi:hypothetical protein